MRKGYREMNFIRLGILVAILLLVTVPTLAETTEGGIFQLVGNIIVEKDQIIDGDVNTMAGNITVHGTVQGDVTSVAGNITIYGTVNGDVQTTGGNIYIKGDAEVTGDATVLGGKVYKDPEAKVQGSMVQMVESDSNGERIQLPADIHVSPYLPWYILIWGGLTGLVSWLALGAFIMLFFAKPIHRLAVKVKQRPGYYFIVGLIAYLVFPPALVLMFITIVGIPLALLSILVVIFGTIYGQLAVARNLGERVIQIFNWQAKTEMARVLIGLLTIFLIAIIPVVGWVFFFATACIGFGTVLINRFGFPRKAKPEMIEDQTPKAMQIEEELLKEDGLIDDLEHENSEENLPIERKGEEENEEKDS